MTRLLSALAFLIPVGLSALINLLTSEDDGIKVFYEENKGFATYLLVGLILLGMIVAGIAERRIGNRKEGWTGAQAITNIVQGLALYSLWGVFVWALATWKFDQAIAWRPRGFLSFLVVPLSWLAVFDIKTFAAGLTGAIAGSHIGAASGFGSISLRVFGFVTGGLAGLSLNPLLLDFCQANLLPILAKNHVPIPGGLATTTLIGGFIGAFTSIFEFQYRPDPVFEERRRSDAAYTARLELAVLRLRSLGLCVFGGGFDREDSFEKVRSRQVKHLTVTII